MENTSYAARAASYIVYNNARNAYHSARNAYAADADAAYRVYIDICNATADADTIYITHKR